MKISVILVCFFLTFNLSAQFRISDFYIGGGYLDSNLDDLNELLNSYPENSTIQFDKVKGFSHFDLGIVTAFTSVKRFSIDIGISYILPKSQEIDFITFKEYSGPSYDDITSGDILALSDTAIYPYGYKIQNYSIGLLPTYELINSKWFSMDIGFGAVFYHTFLKQDGVQVNASPTLWTTEAVSMKTNNFSFGWLGNINFCFQITKQLYLDTQIKYQTGRAKKIAGDLPNWYDSTAPDGNKQIYPVTNVDIDFTGINYILRLRYKI